MTLFGMALAPKETSKELWNGMKYASLNGADELARGTSESPHPGRQILDNIPSAFSAYSGGDPEGGRNEWQMGNHGRSVAAYSAAPLAQVAVHMIGPEKLGGLKDAVSELPRVATETGKFLARAPGELTRRIIAGDITRQLPGEAEGVTPLSRYTPAQADGVKYNAAQATESPVTQAAYDLGRRGLFSENVYNNFEKNNPSGPEQTTGSGSKWAEVMPSATAFATGHPKGGAALGGLVAAQYPIARAMTSPEFVDWLMTPKDLQPPTPPPFPNGQAFPIPPLILPPRKQDPNRQP